MASVLPSFEEFISQAQDNIKTATEHLNEMIGLPKNADASAVFNVFKNNTEHFAKDLSDVVEKIKKQVIFPCLWVVDEWVLHSPAMLGKEISIPV